MSLRMLILAIRTALVQFGRRVATAPVWSVGTWREGQSMVEYAIVAALIAIAAMAAIQGLGIGIAGVFQRILGSIQGIG
jgi:Flp pilus assembly pilin Flp